MEETNSNLRLWERPDTPEWLQTGDLDEVMFCEAFLAQHPMLHVGDSFFGEEGLIHPRRAFGALSGWRRSWNQTPDLVSNCSI